MFHLPFLALAFAFPADVEPVKKQKLSVAFKVPSSAEKAAITEARVVGKELWVRVDVTGGGVGLTVISTAKAEATVEAPALPVRYVVFGKKWNWKNDEKGVVFLRDLGEKEREETEKKYSAGRVVFKVKK
jgi:hypothetical protein